MILEITKMANLFKTAKTVEAPATKSSKKTKPSVSLAGLEELAKLDAVIKALSTIKATVETEVKDLAFQMFFKEAQDKAARPDNFRAVDGAAEASIEMRKRSSASPVVDDLPLFEMHNIPLEKKITTQRLFSINPRYENNDELLEKVSAALEGIVPDDFIMIQEEQSKMIVSDETVDYAFTNKAPEEIIRAISVLAIKPKLSETDISKLIDDVKGYI
jgi:hypothetical protein